MNEILATIVSELPEPSIPEPPALFSDTSVLFVSYQTRDYETFSIVKFNQVFDHWLSSINDEGIGKHPQVKAGLKFYSFHEIINSPKTSQCKILKLKHWVVTFKDNTLDVIGSSFTLERLNIKSQNSATALIEYLSNFEHA